MKKFFLALLAFCYLGTSSGVAMDMHYCMGKLLDITFYSQQLPKADKCCKPIKKSCCSSQQVFYKLSDAHQFAHNDIFIVAPAPAVAPALSCFYLVACTSSIMGRASVAHAPPLQTGRSLRILQCIFRI